MKKKILALLLVIIISLVGCTDDIYLSDSKSSDDSVSISETDEEKTYAYTGRVDRIEMSDEVIFSVFEKFKNLPLYNGDEPTDIHTIQVDGEKEIIIRRIYENSSNYVIADYNINDDYSFGRYNFEQHTKINEDLDFKTRDEVQQEIQEILDQFGMTAEQTYDFYKIDDDAYFVRVIPNIEGIPFSRINYNTAEVTTTDVVYSKDGIVMFEIRQPMNYSELEKVEILSEEEALEKFERMYDDTEIIDMNLVYVSDFADEHENYMVKTLTPAWEAIFESKDGIISVIIDGITNQTNQSPYSLSEYEYK